MLDLPDQCANVAPRLMVGIGSEALCPFGLAPNRTCRPYLLGILAANVTLVATAIAPPVAGEVRPVLGAAPHASTYGLAAANPLYGDGAVIRLR